MPLMDNGQIFIGFNYKFIDMKAKIITTICTFIGALAFVCIPAEAPTIIGQILWSGFWLFVLWLSVIGIDKYGDIDEEDDNF